MIKPCHILCLGLVLLLQVWYTLSCQIGIVFTILMLHIMHFCRVSPDLITSYLDAQ